jgi:hypothetical protein
MHSRKPRFEPQLTVRAIRPLVFALRTLGHDTAPILSAIQLDEALLNDPDAHIPMSAGVNFLSAAVEKTGDTNLGLHLAQFTDPASSSDP